MTAAGGRALVVAGGDAPVADDLAGEPSWEWVVAADSGLDHARALGLDVDLVVGDLDSVAPGTLAAARSAGTEVRAHPSDKDETDLELALDAAAGLGASSMLVIGIAGGRADHALANLLLLASPAYAALDVDARSSAGRVVVVRSRPRSFHGEPGDLLTLLPVHGPARRVRAEGLRWRLEDATLDAASTRGVSNEFAAEWAWVVVGDGVVLAIQPRR